VNKIGGAPEVFGGFANPAIISYLSRLDKSAADSGVDLTDLQDNVDNLSILLSIAQQDINAAELDIVDLQQRVLVEEGISTNLQGRMVVEEGISDDLQDRMDIEEGISVDLLGRMVIEEDISVDLQGRMKAEEATTAVHEAEITVLQDEVIQFSIQDFGRGISPNEIAHIFEPFFRAQSVVEEQIFG
jgi:signal transduction histidine kinase